MIDVIKQAREALHCLRLEVPATVADDVTEKVNAAIQALEARLDLRPNVPAMDDIIGRRIPILGDQCFIEVVDYMGDDAAIVQAARVSYGEGTRKIRSDRALIRYLLSHRHTTPFEMVGLKIVCCVPMDAWRQWIRHRTASVNEYSTRYSEAINACLVTPPGEWRPQSKKNRQGSEEEFLPASIGEMLSRDEKWIQDKGREVYEKRLENGVAREQARKDLPLSTMTEAYWKIDGHNLLHFLGLRCDPGAQKEIRAFAVAIGEVVEAWLPVVWEAFVDYRLEALTLSGPEVELTNEAEWYAVDMTVAPPTTDPVTTHFKIRFQIKDNNGGSNTGDDWAADDFTATQP